ncbi:MAG: hypothetical protein CL666_09440 [Balneola sp.]|nr:hypothetical protein [Balneola sp.]|tara:strand:- start:140129 stop:140347 length:219 start_codon:yes stop_codon:yes gene_type:complete
MLKTHEFELHGSTNSQSSPSEKITIKQVLWSILYAAIIFPIKKLLPSFENRSFECVSKMIPDKSGKNHFKRS